MAPAVASAAPTAGVPRTPIPLSASQEMQVRELYYKRVRTLCAEEIREFATCALNRTFTASWACRAQQRVMNACMVKYATPENQDLARQEWFANKEKRRAEREVKELKRQEQEKFHREWWGLDKNAEAGKAGEGKQQDQQQQQQQQQR